MIAADFQTKEEHVFYSFEDVGLAADDIHSTDPQVPRSISPEFYQWQLSPPVDAPKLGFWRRQFDKDITRSQRQFDWVFGIVLPVVCIFFDPFIFRPELDGKPLLGAFRPFAYSLSFAAIMATMAWLLWGKKLGAVLAPISGLLAVAALASLAIGIVLAPFSLIGIVIIIGFLGFTPLLSSFVYFRTSVRAYRSAGHLFRPDVLKNAWALSAILSAVVPYLLNVWFR